ncbi:hypothetical protein OQX63_14660 [Pedobacter sp. PF22-3]|uniref:hypothetical protein n=1 Tax=Pedobacter sp. PF22-3 TaxID=2994467 RepID=UPI0022474D3B|nr:hypothetical protein [Pedobacter sp. PF22-3]MCX2494726.1 hypothetical protein [Pedobacter sp. PF22-3]
MLTNENYDLAADLATENKEIRLSGKTIGAIHLNSNHYKATSLYLQDSHFIKPFYLKNVDLKKGMFFEGCTFQYEIALENLTSSATESSPGIETKNIHFKNCTFEDSFIVKKFEVSHNIEFDHCQFNAIAALEGIVSENGGLQISSSNYSAGLYIENCILKNDIKVHKSTVFEIIAIRSCKMRSLDLNKKNTFSGGCQIYHCDFEEHIMLQDSIFQGMVNLVRCKTVSQGLYLFSSNFEKGIWVDYRKRESDRSKLITEYHIQGCKFASGFFAMGSPGDYTERSIIDRISLHLSANLSGNINFNDLDVNTIDIQGFNNGTNISFNNLAIGELIIRDTINQGGLIFSGLRATKRQRSDQNDPLLLRSNYIQIANSNLGKALFFQADLSSFDMIRMHNVLLTEISSSSVVWFHPHTLETEHIAELKNQLRTTKRKGDIAEVSKARQILFQKLAEIREIYRQLKFSAQKQGDVPLSLEFQRHEMHYYKKSVAVNRPIKWSEYLILISSMSNDFGQSWLRALLGLFIFSIISFLPVAFFSTKYLDYNHFLNSIDDIPANIHAIRDNLKMWAILVNPAHRTKDLSENIDKFPSVLYLFDLFSRIGISYFLFQMISAFRKFSK